MGWRRFLHNIHHATIGPCGGGAEKSGENGRDESSVEKHLDTRTWTDSAGLAKPITQLLQTRDLQEVCIIIVGYARF